jgi:hypothetical protein
LTQSTSPSAMKAACFGWIRARKKMKRTASTFNSSGRAARGSIYRNDLDPRAPQAIGGPDATLN